MARKILLGCFEVPGWGGASTIQYSLFERLQRDGHDVHCLNLIDAGDSRQLGQWFGRDMGNPRGLEAVHNVVLELPCWQRHNNLSRLIREIKPDVMIGFGFVGAWLLGEAEPDLPLLFHAAGSSGLKRMLSKGVISDFMDFQRQVLEGEKFPLPADDKERAAGDRAKLIVVHSPLVREAFEHFHPGLADRIYRQDIFVADLAYGEAEAFKYLARPFDDRDIDVLFVANDWTRKEKNFGMVCDMTAELTDLRVKVVGVPGQGFFQGELLGLVARREALFGLLGRSRVVVCPSLQDAAPGILFEADAMGCNVVASPNCGNWLLCHEALRVHASQVKAFVKAARRGVESVFTANSTGFLGGYRELRETLLTF